MINTLLKTMMHLIHTPVQHCSINLDFQSKPNDFVTTRAPILLHSLLLLMLFPPYIFCLLLDPKMLRKFIISSIFLIPFFVSLSNYLQSITSVVSHIFPVLHSQPDSPMPLSHPGVSFHWHSSTPSPTLYVWLRRENELCNTAA